MASKYFPECRLPVMAYGIHHGAGGGLVAQTWYIDPDTGRYQRLEQPFFKDCEPFTIAAAEVMTPEEADYWVDMRLEYGPPPRDYEKPDLSSQLHEKLEKDLAALKGRTVFAT